MSRSGGGLGGSRSLLGRLCRVLGRLGCVLQRLGCFLERLGSAFGSLLGASWALLGVSWGSFQRPLGHPEAYWRVLEHLGDVLGSIFVAKEKSIVAYHLGCNFLTDIHPILHLKIDPRSLKNHALEK